MGLASLVKLTPEPMGDHCPSGGQRVDVGLDGNGNGVLDPAEVTQTAYVCNSPGGCAAGSYPGGPSMCTLCPAGSYAAADALTCTACPGGTYSGAGAPACTPCPDGTTGTGEGASACQPAGTVANGTGLPGEADYCQLFGSFPLIGRPGEIIPHWWLGGRIYDDPITWPAEPDPNVIGQIGYGPAGSNAIAALSSWSFFPAPYLTSEGGIDTYAGPLPLPTRPGTYAYAFRFSIDGGSSFNYCDLDGVGPPAVDHPFTTDQQGVLQVIP
jgi:hypothetical protein